MQDLNHNANNQDSTNSRTEVTSTAANKQIVFIDATVADKESLVAGVKPGTEVIILDSTRDGVAQITEVLANRSDIASVHIVSHGAEGSLQLGASAVNSDNLQAYSNSLQQWTSALTADADILLYGCDVASGGSGEAFVQQLSQLTGADVAASDDLTGSAVKGGDWDLEVKTGAIESPIAFLPAALANYNFVLPVSFAPATNFGVGTEPSSLVVGDFNGDKILDLVTANLESDNVSVLLGKGDGTFNSASNISVGSGPYSVAIGDINGDKILDLATANYNSYTSSILLGKGDGTFNSPSNVSHQQFPYSVGIGDFNGDGKGDLVTAKNSDYNNISVSLSNGDGTFKSANNTSIGNGPRFVAIGDINGDGKADLAIPNYFSKDVSVLLSNGDGTFKSSSQLSVGSSFFSVAIGDINGDGKADLATANFQSSNNVSVFLGKGDGTFNTASNLSAGSYPYSVAIGDIDGDGKADLVTADAYSDTASVLLGNGDGTFNSASNFRVGSLPQYVAIGDFNGDGKLDLATANYRSNNVSVLLQVEPNQAPSVTLPGAAVAYTENAAATIIDSTATVADTDSANFQGGTLTVRYTAGGSSSDRLSIANIGSIAISGTTVSHAGTAIGTIASNGSNGSNLVINLNASATPTVTQELLRSIAYSSTSENPTASRTVQFVLTDGDGGTSTAATKTITVTPVNDAPNFTAGAAQNVMANSGAQTVTRWATNFNPGTEESTQTLDSYIVNVVNNAGIFAAAPTIDINGNLTFTPVANIATSTTATIEVRAKDNGGTANGGVDTSVAKTFNITVNPQPKISISDVTITEGNTGIAFAEFQVSLSNASTETVSVNYATANNTAIAGSDYTAINDTLTFAPGVTTQTFRVAVNGDMIDEPNESFFVNLSNPSKATIIDAQGIGNIIDNDTAGFTITPISGNTSEMGGTTSFSVKLNSKPTADVTLSLASSDTTEGTISNSKLTFTESNWNDAQTVTVKGVDDTLVDGNIAYKIVTNAAVSADTKYNNLNPVDVNVVNINDNDIPIANFINGNRLHSDTLVGTAQNDQINCYRGHDTITGGMGSDRIYGNAGSDALYGDMSSMVGTVGGDDLIWGGSGSDRIYGGYGHDSLYGGVANDLLWGDAGRDRLSGGLGSDSLTGGAGRDTFVLAKGEGVDTITDFQMGRDFIGLAGGLSLGQVSITQRSSQAVITNNSDGEILAAINNISAATLQSYAASTFVTI
ncbi:MULTISPECIES: DUF4347 domain-containing protein [Cyanophyceae]|uniref:DUF4347 domain-containing protein n=1 Tax=Cyanophyceae TaxID=3028117 RepID=UPI001684F30C|nr:DUF4347 domain-containing protein [Trichocoleus sp. FACHB-40]